MLDLLEPGAHFVPDFRGKIERVCGHDGLEVAQAEVVQRGVRLHLVLCLVLSLYFVCLAETYSHRRQGGTAASAAALGHLALRGSRYLKGGQRAALPFSWWGE